VVPGEWGWILLVIAILLILAGLSLFSGAAWAGVVAITLAVLSAVSNFFFIPYYPFWSILEIALACWVIWAITRPGLFDDNESGRQAADAICGGVCRGPPVQ